MKRLLSFAVIAFASCSLTVAQAPLNDECSGAIPIALGANPGLCLTFNNVLATTSAGYPAICNTISSDVWFSFTPSTTGVYRFDTEAPAGCPAGTETDTVVAAYSSCTPGAPLGCDDDSGTGLLSILNVGLCANQTYFIRVGSFGAQSVTNNGTFYLNVSTSTTTFSQIWCTPGPGCVQISIVNGIPNGTYFLAATTNVGAFPNGWLYGIDITVQEIQNELNAGFPFVGTLDAMGNISLGPVCGLPSGLTVCSVAIDFAAGTGLSVPSAHTTSQCTTIQ